MRLTEILRPSGRQAEPEASPAPADALPRLRPRRRRVVLSLAALAAGLSLLLALAASRKPFRRRTPFTGPARPAALPGPEIAALPVEQWTARFIALQRGGEWEALAHQLEDIRADRGDVFEAYRLGYLLARARLEADLAGAEEAFRPFLAPGHPLRDLALYYQAEIADERGDEEESASLREELILQYPQATYRDAALADHTDYLHEQGDPARLQEFASRVAPTVSAGRKRDLEARIVETLQARGDGAQAIARGIRLLKEGSADDPAERVSHALDRPELIEKVGPDEWVLIGESARSHRHFDRAVALLEKAMDRLPARRDDLLFSIGRAHFGAERFAEAEKSYARGAEEAKSSEGRATFFYHASRAAQLAGHDARAEAYMTRAIQAAGTKVKAPATRAKGKAAGAAKGRRGRGAKRGNRKPAPPAVAKTTLPAASSALIQRLRTRLAQERFAEAETDLDLARKRFPGEAAIDATLAYAAAMVAEGRAGAALKELERLAPPSDRYLAAEVDYWRGRTQEAVQPQQALRHYLKALRADVPTHFAYFARQRLAQPALAGPLKEELARRSAEVQRLVEARDFEAARALQTDVVLISLAPERPAEVAILREIYRELPAYRQALELQPLAFPRFPLPGVIGPETGPEAEPAPASEPDRLDLLLAMGLFDDAIDLVPVRYGLSPPPSALTRSLALHLGSAPRGSIYAVEILMKSVPPDFVPELLPREVKELLYPRYFYDDIVADSAKHGADPRLVLSIMREESRFDPRAKSLAAARGLLQFIITTARDVGRSLGLVDLSSEDLYDPRVIIQLGAKYVADLLGEFAGDPYRAAAAYNAGPQQVKLWARLSPDGGHDSFLSSVSFDETKNYVRKVLNSYERYGEIYEDRGPVGGVRVEP